MSLIDWEDLPISTRKSPRKLYNVLKEEFGLIEWNGLSVIERRSMKKRYALLRESLSDLPSWEELSIIDRRSHKRLYKRIKSVSENEGYNPRQEPLVEAEPTPK